METTETPPDQPEENAAPFTGPIIDESSRKPERLVSLDAFRGLTILGMLLVNNIALDTATPAQLVHAGWNKGLTFADMVFPWFLLAVGVAVPYSSASRKRQGVSEWRYNMRVIGRTVTLVLLGCLIDSSISRTPLFDLGVLQLIGLAYLVGALLYELPVQRRLIIAGTLLAWYWALIRFLPVPGMGAGVFTPEHNVINHLNQVYLTAVHLKGILSVIPTAALVMIGTAAGDILISHRLQPTHKLSHLAVLGLGLTVIGWLWARDLPFNKPLWTTPYVLYSSGLGCLVLAFFFLTIDITKWRAWALPLVIPGMNAIFVYVVPILVKVYIFQVWTWKLADGSHLPLGVAFMHYWFAAAGRYWGGWGYTISYILFWWLVAVWLYRKKIFLRV